MVLSYLGLDSIPTSSSLEISTTNADVNSFVTEDDIQLLFLLLVSLTALFAWAETLL
jgi:hypothetical protein